MDDRCGGGDASREYVRPPLGEPVPEAVAGPVRRQPVDRRRGGGGSGGGLGTVRRCLRRMLLLL